MSRRLPSSPLPYSKTADVAGDAEQLRTAYALMQHHPDLLAGQHEIRKWEYGMALRTISAWEEQRNFDEAVRGGPLQIADVGGAGSNFWLVLTGLTSEDIVRIDPTLPTEFTPAGRKRDFKGSVEQYAATQTHGQFDILTCISVIEHIEQLRPFFRACHMLLRPGGLLFLTTDYCDAEGDDIYHFHWMRKRIYNADRVQRLLTDVRKLGFRSFGDADWAYHGAQAYDYSVCSIALLRKGD